MRQGRVAPKLPPIRGAKTTQSLAPKEILIPQPPPSTAARRRPTNRRVILKGIGELVPASQGTVKRGRKRNLAGSPASETWYYIDCIDCQGAFLTIFQHGGGAGGGKQYCLCPHCGQSEYLRRHCATCECFVWVKSGDRNTRPNRKTRSAPCPSCDFVFEQVTARMDGFQKPPRGRFAVPHHLETKTVDTGFGSTKTAQVWSKVTDYREVSRIRRNRIQHRLTFVETTPVEGWAGETVHLNVQIDPPVPVAVRAVAMLGGDHRDFTIVDQSRVAVTLPDAIERIGLGITNRMRRGIRLGTPDVHLFECGDPREVRLRPFPNLRLTLPSSPCKVRDDVELTIEVDGDLPPDGAVVELSCALFEERRVQLSQRSTTVSVQLIAAGSRNVRVKPVEGCQGRPKELLRVYGPSVCFADSPITPAPAEDGTYQVGQTITLHFVVEDYIGQEFTFDLESPAFGPVRPHVVVDSQSGTVTQQVKLKRAFDRDVPIKIVNERGCERLAPHKIGIHVSAPATGGTGPKPCPKEAPPCNTKQINLIERQGEGIERYGEQKRGPESNNKFTVLPPGNLPATQGAEQAEGPRAEIGMIAGRAVMRDKWGQDQRWADEARFHQTKVEITTEGHWCTEPKDTHFYDQANHPHVYLIRDGSPIPDHPALPDPQAELVVDSTHPKLGFLSRFNVVKNLTRLYWSDAAGETYKVLARSCGVPNGESETEVPARNLRSTIKVYPSDEFCLQLKTGPLKGIGAKKEGEATEEPGDTSGNITIELNGASVSVPSGWTVGRVLGGNASGQVELTSGGKQHSGDVAHLGGQLLQQGDSIRALALRFEQLDENFDQLMEALGELEEDESPEDPTEHEPLTEAHDELIGDSPYLFYGAFHEDQEPSAVEPKTWKSKAWNWFKGKVKKVFKNWDGRVTLYVNGRTPKQLEALDDPIYKEIASASKGISRSINVIIGVVNKTQKVFDTLKLVPTMGFSIDFKLAFLEGELEWRWGWKEFSDQRAFFWKHIYLGLYLYSTEIELSFGIKKGIWKIKFEAVIYGSIKGQLYAGGYIEQIPGQQPTSQITATDTMAPPEQQETEWKHGEALESRTTAQLGVRTVLLHENILKAQGCVEGGYRYVFLMLQDRPGIAYRKYFEGLKAIVTASSKFFKEKKKEWQLIDGDGRPRASGVFPSDPDEA